MALTTQQVATLKAYILADPVLSAKPMTSGGAAEIAVALNQPAAVAFYVWRNSTPAADILDAIVWASLTPADTADGSAIYTNRALVAQARQLNLQIILQGRESIPTGRPNVRQGLTDALLGVPTGVGGALLDAGWLGAGKVKTTITRQTSVVEKLFATGTGTVGVPGVLVYEGPITSDDVQFVRES